jgi:hypothetical protein
MFRIRSLALSVLCLVLSGPIVEAQDLSAYRGFRLGMTLAAAAQQGRLPVTAARVLYQRPQLIQELEWQPQTQTGAANPEAVKTVRFTFYDGRLCKITVAYDRNRIEGLTAEDFVDAMSASYGPPILASTQMGVAVPAAYMDYNLGSELTVAAEWEDSRYSIRVVQSRFPSAFGLVLLSREPDRLAREAAAAAARLDTLEAPQREAIRLQSQADEERARAVKARSANKPVFRF